MGEILDLDIKGIKCDNKDCEYVDNNVEYKDYPEWIGKPCPLCGSNLLTEEDYKLCEEYMKKAKLLDSVFSLIPIFKKDKKIVKKIPFDRAKNIGGRNES